MNQTSNKTNLLSIFFISQALSALALAAPQADLTISIFSAPSARVYDQSTHTIRVSNLSSNKDASNSVLKVQLPITDTSPQVKIMGEISGLSTGCTVSGTLLTCNLGTVAKNNFKQISYNFKLPYSTKVLKFDANVVTTTTESNLNNNSRTVIPAITYYSVAVAESDLNNKHCTGTALTSYM